MILWFSWNHPQHNLMYYLNKMCSGQLTDCSVHIWICIYLYDIENFSCCQHYEDKPMARWSSKFFIPKDDDTWFFLFPFFIFLFFFHFINPKYAWFNENIIKWCLLISFLNNVFKFKIHQTSSGWRKKDIDMVSDAFWW